jgi:glycosyltransferase involved in cell wall biosynthesis
MSASVAVVICAYDERRLELLERAVASVLAQTRAPAEVVVAVDHNPILLARARARLPRARVIANGGGRGAGEARNAGVAATRAGDVLAFLDDDACAAPDWIERALVSFADARVMGVGGTIAPDWEGARPGWFPSEFNWTVGCSYPGLPTRTAPVRNLIAASMFVRRGVFEELGGFRPGFGKRGTRSRPEETELCLRANSRWPDGIWLHDPAVAIRHSVPPGRGRARYFLSRCYEEGRGKAELARFAGSGAALAAEREYTRRTLPAGVAAGLRDALSGRDRAGLARSAAIITGLAVTAVGYTHGLLTAGAVGQMTEAGAP